MYRDGPRRAPLLFLIVFGAVFALLVVLVASIVVGSSMRTAATPVDQDAREGWMLLLALAVVLAGATFFGALLRLPLAERRLGRPEVELDPPSPEPGKPLAVRLRFVPPFPVRLRHAWVEIAPQVNGGATPRAERTVLSSGSRDLAGGTSTELVGRVPVPDSPSWILTVYVGIALWPDWRLDVVLSRAGGGDGERIIRP